MSRQVSPGLVWTGVYIVLAGIVGPPILAALEALQQAQTKRHLLHMLNQKAASVQRLEATIEPAAIRGGEQSSSDAIRAYLVGEQLMTVSDALQLLSEQKLSNNLLMASVKLDAGSVCEDPLQWVTRFSAKARPIVLERWRLEASNLIADQCTLTVELFVVVEAGPSANVAGGRASQ